MNFLRGWFGEMKVRFYIWLWLPKTVYTRFHNIILPSSNGTTQIDHLIVSVYGLFIVETKNKKGWIFGSARQRVWTQVIFGKKYSFQNPINQTYRQRKVLSEYLEVNETKIYTVVFFVGDCRFKTDLPVNVIRSGISRYIKRFDREVFTTNEVSQIVNTLEAQIAKKEFSLRDHRRSLRRRHSSKTICPRCGSDLTIRTVKKGRRAGRQFYGCTSFPKCRYSRS